MKKVKPSRLDSTDAELSQLLRQSAQGKRQAQVQLLRMMKADPSIRERLFVLRGEYSREKRKSMSTAAKFKKAGLVAPFTRPANTPFKVISIVPGGLPSLGKRK